MTSIEKHSFKISIGVAVTVIIFLIAFAFKLGAIQSQNAAIHDEITAKCDHIGDKIVDMRSDIDALEATDNSRAVDIATINTKLANIETLLIEIKQDLRDN